jgi:hypothetical protein
MFYRTLAKEKIKLSNIGQFKSVILAGIVVNMEVGVPMKENAYKLKK